MACSNFFCISVSIKFFYCHRRCKPIFPTWSVLSESKFFSLVVLPLINWVLTMFLKHFHEKSSSKSGYLPSNTLNYFCVTNPRNINSKLLKDQKKISRFINKIQHPTIINHNFSNEFKKLQQNAKQS